MNKQSGQLRIIGGEWRGRKLSFPAADDLRPTPDRVRETLFNWLQGIIEGARCLDLFAGSGALGLEALSRGAGEVVFVEQNPRVADQIRQHLTTLKCTHGRVINSDAFSFLRGPVTPFDIIFLDPPYRLDCLTQCCELLTERGWLKNGTRIYLENPSKQGPPALPPTWNLLRSKTAGDVGYHLAASA